MWKVLYLSFLVVVISLTYIYNGFLFHWAIDSALVVVASTVYPFLVNRSQLLSLFEHHGRPSHLDASPGGGGPLTVLSYNIFMRPGLWFIRNNDSDYKDLRLAAFLNAHLENYSILCLQEMFGLLSWRQRTLLERAAQQGFCHAAVTGAPPYLFWDRHWKFKIPFLDAGVVILSRFPIVETDSHYYTLGHQIDGWAPKQVLWALVQLPGDNNFVHVFNTHMQASYYDAPSDTSDMARAKQVNELAEFARSKIYKRGESPYPAIICGDFNLDARSKSGAHSLDYLRMMDVLARELASATEGFVVRDVVYESHQSHPVTYGDVITDSQGQLVPRETVLTHKADYLCQISIDYVFFVGPAADQPGRFLQHKATRIEPFLCEAGEAPPCTQLSDHHGIVSTFNLDGVGVGVGGDEVNNNNNTTTL